MVKYLLYFNIIFYLVIGFTISFTFYNVESIFILCTFILIKLLYKFIFNLKQKSNFDEKNIVIYSILFLILIFIYYIINSSDLSFVIMLFYYIISNFLVFYISKNKRSLFCSYMSIVSLIILYCILLIFDLIKYINYHDLFVSVLIILILNSIYKLYKNINESKKNDCLILVLIIITRIFNNYSFIYIIIPFVILDLCINNKIKLHLVSNNKKKYAEKISVIIPNYNYGRYLNNRIKSIINQTISVDEIIIIDDASTDESDKIISEIIKNNKDYKIKYIKNDINSKNVFEQWKKAFEIAKNDLIWICEADDLCHPTFLEKVLSPMNDKDILISYAESVAIDSKDNILFEDFRNWNSTENNNRWKNNFIHEGTKEIKEQLIKNNSINNVSGVVFRKNKKINYNKLLDDAKKFTLSGDWYFYVEILKYGKIAYNAQSLNYHRIHDKSVTSTIKEEDKIKETKKIQKMIRDYLDKRG